MWCFSSVLKRINMNLNGWKNQIKVERNKNSISSIQLREAYKKYIWRNHEKPLKNSKLNITGTYLCRWTENLNFGKIVWSWEDDLNWHPCFTHNWVKRIQYLLFTDWISLSRSDFPKRMLILRQRVILVACVICNRKIKNYVHIAQIIFKKPSPKLNFCTLNFTGITTRYTLILITGNRSLLENFEAMGNLIYTVYFIVIKNENEWKMNKTQRF